MASLYHDLPQELQSEIVKYLPINPVAKLIKWWKRNEEAMPIMIPKERIVCAKIINTRQEPKKCGCLFWEQHQIDCRWRQASSLPGYCNIVKLTPLQQADQKRLLLLALKNYFKYFQEETDDCDWPDTYWWRTCLPQCEQPCGLLQPLGPIPSVHPKHKHSLSSQQWRVDHPCPSHGNERVPDCTWFSCGNWPVESEQ